MHGRCNVEEKLSRLGLARLGGVDDVCADIFVDDEDVDVSDFAGSRCR